MREVRWAVLCLCLCPPLLALPTAAAAQSAPTGTGQPPGAKVVFPRNLAVGISTAKELGLAAAQVRFRHQYVGAEVSFGVMPILLMASGDCNTIVFDVGLHATGSLLVFFNNDQKRFANGLRLGGIWDDKFGFGGQLGWQAELRLSRWLSLSFGAGLQIYPEAEDWAKDRIREECDAASIEIELNPMLTYVQPYMGVGLLLYLL